MAKKDSSAELQEAILMLQSKQQEELKRMKKEFEDVKDRLKPKNLLREGISKFKHSSALKTVLIIAGLGVTSGLVIKKLRRRKLHARKMMHNNYQKQDQGQVKKVSGSILKYVITALISQHSDKLRSLAYQLFSRMKSAPNSKVNNRSGNPSKAQFQ